MRFNSYSYDLYNSNFEKIENQYINIQIRTKLDILEGEIANEFIKAQKDRPGIKKLGNEIKSNKVIQQIFNDTTENEEVLIKLTAHYHSYLNTIINALNEHCDKGIYLFVFEEQFRKSSRIVDSSSKGAEFIKEILDKLSSIFTPIDSRNNQLVIIEMKGFEHYSVVQINDYSKLIKK